MKNIVVFGAGKIGRSFIGQVFSKAGYQVVFADTDKFLVNEINYQKEYNVIVKGENERIIPVFNVRAIHLSDEEILMNELDNSNISAVCVGQKGLPVVAEIIARYLERRQHRMPGSPLDLIIAENMRDSDIYFKGLLQKFLPERFPIQQNIGLIETSIGKMVPIMTSELNKLNSLQIFAEEYNTLILGRKSFLNPLPEVPELAPKDNIKAWVDRKLFIHNFGHSALAYLSAYQHPGYIFTWEALANSDLHKEVYETMKESAAILRSVYPDEFTAEELELHIRDLLKRFANKSLGDTIYRVGSDLARKLGPDDRIVPLIRIANSKKMPFKKILKVLISGIFFQAKDEKGKMSESDRNFNNRYKCNYEKVLKEHCGFDVSADKHIFKDASVIFQGLKTKTAIVL